MHTRILPKPVLFTINCNPMSETKSNPTDQKGVVEPKYPVGKPKSKKHKKTTVKFSCEGHIRRARKIRVK